MSNSPAALFPFSLPKAFAEIRGQLGCDCLLAIENQVTAPSELLPRVRHAYTKTNVTGLNSGYF